VGRGQVIKTEKGMPRDHISFTQLSMYDECPAKYKAVYLDEIPQPGSLALDYGDVLHKTIRRINNHIISLKDKDNWDVFEAKEFYNAEFNRKKLPVALNDKGWQKVLKYAEETFVRRAVIFKAEYELRYILRWKDEEIEIIGIIDRLDLVGNGLKLVEYKSGSRLLSRDELDDDLQMMIYTFLVHRNFPEHDEIFNSYYSLGLGKETLIKKDLDTLTEFEDSLIVLWQKMACDKTFKATGRGCSYCPIKAKCSKYEEAITQKLGKVNTNDLNAVVDRFRDVKARILILEGEEETLGDLIKSKFEDTVEETIETKDSVITLVEKGRDSQKCLKNFNCKDARKDRTEWQEIKLAKRYKPLAELKKKKKRA
jgi:hypothetical protein